MGSTTALIQALQSFRLRKRLECDTCTFDRVSFVWLTLAIATIPFSWCVFFCHVELCQLTTCNVWHVAVWWRLAWLREMSRNCFSVMWQCKGRKITSFFFSFLSFFMCASNLKSWDVCLKSVWRVFLLQKCVCLVTPRTMHVREPGFLSFPCESE